MNDLLRICQQFMELIIDPLPRQVFNDYEEEINDYLAVVRVLDAMSSCVFASSQELKDKVPGLTSILNSNGIYQQPFGDIDC